MKILALSTYPVARPRHGGQKRVHALKALYQRLGADLHVAAVHDPSYAKEDVGPHDIVLGHGSATWADTPFMGDLQSGEFAANSPAAYRHFESLVRTLQPDAFTLEQPFMWPLVRRLKENGVAADVPVIYSSHNWEAPLKEAILIRAGVSRPKAKAIAAAIVALEQDAVDGADLVLTVSDSDLAIYRALAPGKLIAVAPNGVDLPSDAPSRSAILDPYEGRKFLFYVGSSYPPNIEGFVKLVCEDGFFFTPPLKSFAVCGGVCDQIFQSDAYQRFVHANSERVQFFPNTTDEDLDMLKAATHGVVLPIQFGGGSNLKTAEALVSEKWVVATPTAMRGFERFIGATGVLIAETPDQFRAAMIQALRNPPLQLSGQDRAARRAVTWERAFREGGAEEVLRTFLASRTAGAAIGAL